MKVIPISAIPNQSFSARLDNSLYDITIKEARGSMVISMTRDGATLLDAIRLTPGTPIIPYAYKESGNFVLTNINDDLPDYNKFGVSQNLIYLSAAEMAALSA